MRKEPSPQLFLPLRRDFYSLFWTFPRFQLFSFTMPARLVKTGEKAKGMMTNGERLLLFLHFLLSEPCTQKALNHPFEVLPRPPEPLAVDCRGQGRDRRSGDAHALGVAAERDVGLCPRGEDLRRGRKRGRRRGRLGRGGRGCCWSLLVARPLPPLRPDLALRFLLRSGHGSFSC